MLGRPCCHEMVMVITGFSYLQLQRRHEQMMTQLEKQQHDLDEKRRQFEQDKGAFQAQQRKYQQEQEAQQAQKAQQGCVYELEHGVVLLFSFDVLLGVASYCR